jgi:ABC-type branched-subunit amino acid transport system ATPase component/branched-subunit amino acid ABC-type transport system permease component
MGDKSMTGLVAATMTLPGTSFEIPSNVVILGVITGLTYALIGVGLTLIYRTTRVLNFATGEMGALPAVLIPILVLNNNWPYWLALPLSLVGAIALSGAMEAFVIRPMSRGPRLTILVATIGLAQVFFGLNLLLPRGGDLTGKPFPTPFDWRLTIGSLVLGPGQLLIVFVAPLCIVLLTWYLNRSPLGKASRAAAENAEAAQLAGVPIGRVSFNVWVIAGLLAGVGAILAGATRPLTLSAALGPALLLRALGASMIGGLRSIWGSFAGGIAIGIVEALIIWNYPVGGVLEVVLAGLILASMLLRPALGRGPRGGDNTGWSLTAAIRPLAPALAQHPRVRAAKWITLTTIVALAVLAPFAVRPADQISLSNVVLTAMMCLSLVVLTGYAGHVSLGQFAFVGIGAATGGRLYQMGIPHLPAAILVTMIGAAVATVLGLPAMRMRGLFLSVATLGFALAVSSWLFFQEWFVHVDDEKGTSLQLPRPQWLGIDFDQERAYYWLCLAVLLLVAGVVYRMRRTGLGRSMIAVRDNELSAASMAQSPRRVKLTAFALSGAIASLAGFLFGGLRINFSSTPGSTFSPSESLSLVVTAVFGGITSVTGAVLGSLWIVGIPRLLGDDYALFSSGFAVVLILLLLPGGLANVVFRLRDRAVEWLVKDDPVVTAAPAAAVRPTLQRIEQRPALGGVQPINAPHPIEAVDISVRFGGLQALDSVSVHAKQGEILGLMGPNGAGKTTLFDVLGGNLRADSGRVHVGGTDITRMASYKRARIGVGRTYQQARLFGDLTTVESVCIALEQRHRAWLLPTLCAWPTTFVTERRRRGDACEILDLLEIGAYADRPVSQLPTGIRRVAELACVIALQPDVLLLDEPTAGFTAREVASFLEVVHEVRGYLDATIVMIDHDIHVMRDLVDRLYVLAVGRVIAEGPPSVLETDGAVRDVYTGAA